MQVNIFISEVEGRTDKKPMSSLEVALGFIDVANEAMCRPIRALTQVCYQVSCIAIILSSHKCYSREKDMILPGMC